MFILKYWPYKELIPLVHRDTYRQFALVFKWFACSLFFAFNIFKPVSIISIYYAQRRAQEQPFRSYKTLWKTIFTFIFIICLYLQLLKGYYLSIVAIVKQIGFIWDETAWYPFYFIGFMKMLHFACENTLPVSTIRITKIWFDIVCSSII